MEHSKAEDFVVSILSLAPEKSLSPVQIQKLFFLLEKRLGIKHFDFKPHHYGPYDRNLTALLTFSDKIDIVNVNSITYYKVKEGEVAINSNLLSEAQKKFAIEMIKFIKKLSFKELCMSIYKEFPEMAINSVLFK